MEGRAENPLAYATLWDRAKPRTSQRRAIQDLGDVVTVILGGNRSGKTTSAAQLVAAVAMGRDDPAVKVWLRVNQIPPYCIPKEPGRVWAVALDSGDSREYVRPAVAQYLPPGTTWRNRDGFGRAEATTPQGGRVSFLSADAGRDGFQGQAVDLVWLDEEPTGARGQAVVNECLMRLVDRRGRMVFTMTPLSGMTWLYDRWVAETPSDTRVHWIHGMDNPHIPADALAALLAQFGPHERAARERGEFTTIEGRVYSDWRRDLHVVPAFDPPADWERLGSIDFGTRNPFCFLYMAVDPSDDTLHIVDEYYQPERTLAQHAGAIDQIINHGRPSPLWIVADPEDRGSRLSLAREHGISTTTAKKQIRAGINSVAERLRPDAEGRPHLVVHDRCTNLIREIEGYVWDQRAGKDAPVKRNDHAMDALRYACHQLARSEWTVG